MRHFLLYCPDFKDLCVKMLETAQSDNLEDILTLETGTQAAVRMLLRSGILAQFRLAHEIAENPTLTTTPLQDLDSWT